MLKHITNCTLHELLDVITQEMAAYFDSADSNRNIVFDISGDEPIKFIIENENVDIITKHGRACFDPFPDIRTIERNTPAIYGGVSRIQFLHDGVFVDIKPGKTYGMELDILRCLITESLYDTEVAAAVAKVTHDLLSTKIVYGMKPKDFGYTKLLDQAALCCLLEDAEIIDGVAFFYGRDTAYNRVLPVSNKIMAVGFEAVFEACMFGVPFNEGNKTIIYGVN